MHGFFIGIIKGDVEMNGGGYGDELNGKHRRGVEGISTSRA
jgi:hypothetical protein